MEAYLVLSSPSISVVAAASLPESLFSPPRFTVSLIFSIWIQPRPAYDTRYVREPIAAVVAVGGGDSHGCFPNATGKDS